MILSLSHLHALYSSDSSDALYSTSFSSLCVCVFGNVVSTRTIALSRRWGRGDQLSVLLAGQEARFCSVVASFQAYHLFFDRPRCGLSSPSLAKPPSKILELSCSLERRCPAS